MGTTCFMTNVVIFRPRPPKRLRWSCNARVSSTSYSKRSRYYLISLGL